MNIAARFFFFSTILAAGSAFAAGRFPVSATGSGQGVNDFIACDAAKSHAERGLEDRCREVSPRARVQQTWHGLCSCQPGDFPSNRLCLVTSQADCVDPN